MVVADPACRFPLPVALEPEQRRSLAVDCEDAGRAGRHFPCLLIDDRDVEAGHRQPGRTKVDGVAEAVVVADRHADLDLAVVVVDRAVEVLTEPPYHFKRHGGR